MAVGFGFVPGFIASGLGTALMVTLGKRFAQLRSRVAWVIAGVILPIPFGSLPGYPEFADPSPLVFALAFSLPGAICAAICWRFEQPSPDA